MRFAICNETFEGWPHARVCKYIAGLGYQGLELAPFTLAARITDVKADERRTLRQQAEDSGLAIIGLHWLLAKTEGLQLTSPIEAVRIRTAAYIGELARCCHDLGGDILVFGSPAQRRIPAGCTHAQATDFAQDTLQRAMPEVEDCRRSLLPGAAGPSGSRSLTTCAEGAALMDRVGSRAGCLHLDVRACRARRFPSPT